ncbi:MAG TPA: class I SAM-dependent rRNA methyltransferase [Gammaproteobacteria bacterium]|nr:class I SAM-dependent rRNA methyltransferase [Gammaproteobacteria bacterium]
MKTLSLKKGEDGRLRSGHPWVYSNEIDTTKSPLSSYTAGELVRVVDHHGSKMGVGTINPQALITVRLLSTDASAAFDHQFFTKRLTAALALRERLFNTPHYRLVFSEADALPGLVIDRYGQHAVVQINTAGMEAMRDVIGAALKEVIPELTSILLSNENSMRTHEKLNSYQEDLLGLTPAETIIQENGVSFSIPLLAGQKTGWFYDHRLNRLRLKDYVKDKRVLDVFSYLGGWGIQAAAFGAASVDCIEASKLACDLIKHNATLNNVADKVTVIQSDAFDAMKALIQAGKTYDVITLDPPAFVKRAKDRREGMLAYQRVNELALKLLSPGGVLVSCSCSMHVSLEELQSLVQRAAVRTRTSLQILERGHQGPDHPIHPAIPETDYLKAIFLRKL